MRALEQSRSTNSMVALIHALKVKIPGIRNEAARAILRSGSSLGKIEIIRNVKSLSPEIVASLGNDESNLDLPIGHCLQHGDDEIALRALDTIEAGKIYRELPLVLNFLRKSTGLAAERAEQVLSSLIEGAYEMQRDLRGDKLVVHSQQIEGIIQQLWTELNAAVPQVRVEILATMILILTDAEHPVARMLIREANEIVQKTVWELLKTSKHPGILRHLNSALSVKYIPSGIIDVITSRSDIEFQIAFLRATPEKPNIHQDRNYKLINGLVWLNPTPELWETVPEELHPAVIRTIKLISLNEFMKSAFAQSIFQEGSIAARKAAPEFKAYLSQDQFERLILHAVESENPEEEAWGLSVIQDTGVPEKHRYLVNKLDSPHDVVVEQARKSIGRFDVAGVIEFAESAKPAVGPRLASVPPARSRSG